MNRRLLMFLLAVFIVPCLLVSSGSALEKSAARYTDVDRNDQWRSGTETCSIIYHNTCTGWIWIWSSWSPEDRLGVGFETCCPDTLTGNLLAGWMFVQSGSPMGYGFTGTVDVWAADANGCPTGGSLASTSLLPVSGWNLIDYVPSGGVVVPPEFAMTFTLGAGMANPVAFVTDHPAAGPTGPVACGACYPTSRANHTFFFGTPTSPLCPGSPLDDGICFAQFLWDVQMECIVTSIEGTSWSEIKNLYR